ncbi:hypothetical protein [Nonomuraea rubra]|uniref:hypothetical protein n=1 Tax=Nonomuraea rubra TaxID=46180 RepID=UPI0031EBA2F9
MPLMASCPFRRNRRTLAFAGTAIVSGAARRAGRPGEGGEPLRRDQLQQVEVALVEVVAA